MFWNFLPVFLLWIPFVSGPFSRNYLTVIHVVSLVRESIRRSPYPQRETFLNPVRTQILRFSVCYDSLIFIEEQIIILRRIIFLFVPHTVCTINRQMITEMTVLVFSVDYTVCTLSLSYSVAYIEKVCIKFFLYFFGWRYYHGWHVIVSIWSPDSWVKRCPRVFISVYNGVRDYLYRSLYLYSSDLL